MGFFKVQEFMIGEFNEAICRNVGFRYPPRYLRRSLCFGWRLDGKIVAGFVLSPFEKDVRDLRVIHQIPWIIYANGVEQRLRALGFKSMSDRRIWEFTGYFIEDRSIAARFFIRGMIEILRTGGRWFFGAFESSNGKLRHYYGMGNPIDVYEGKVEFEIEDVFRLPEKKTDIESIKILSILGIAKIVFWRLRRIAVKKAAKLLKGVFR